MMKKRKEKKKLGKGKWKFCGRIEKLQETITFSSNYYLLPVFSKSCISRSWGKLK